MAGLAPLRPLVGLLVGAPSSGAGKTVFTLGLIAAMRRRGLAVAAGKVGPDFIDTAFLSAAAGSAAVNLDLWAMRGPLLDRLADRTPLVVEGVMGLFDGPQAGRGSSADVAKRLGLPVVLVLNAQRMSHSVAALAHGFITFDAALEVAGVVLTRVGSPRHEAMLREALAARDIRCFGALPSSEGVAIGSRHLGLVQACEANDLAALVTAAADLVETHCDVDALCRLERRPVAPPETVPPLAPIGSRIAVAQDEAFAFAYAHLLNGWHDAGASLHPFSPLADEAPDESADAVFLPGGYPELHAGRLAAGRAWRHGLSRRAEAGALVYGECGGYMALGERLVDREGVSHEMAGLLPVTTSFKTPRRTLGYRTLRHGGSLLPFARTLRGHEFHYASLAEGIETGLFEASDAAGTAKGLLGVSRGRVAGSFAHVIDGPAEPLRDKAPANG